MVEVKRPKSWLSGLKEIIDSYRRYERFPNYHAPDFSSNASEFYVTLWNLNYEQFLKDVTKERKEFLKAQRKIYRFVSEKPNITTIEMAERMGGGAKRQLLRYIKRLTDMNLIVREGGRKALAFGELSTQIMIVSLLLNKVKLSANSYETELGKEVLPPLTIFIKQILLGTCIGTSFVDSTPLRVFRNQQILIHKTFEGLAERGKCFMN